MGARSSSSPRPAASLWGAASRTDGLQWMSPEEVAAVTVPFAEVGQRLPVVMQEFGLAVVEGVVVGAELEGLLAAWQRDLRSLVDEEALRAAPTGVREAFERFLQEGPSAFPLASSKKFTTMSGFAVDRCLCHGEFAWAVRSHEHVHEAFRALFGPGPLVTSLDVPFFTPHDVGSGPKNPWDSAHVDQNLHDARGDLGSIDEYQGVLYAWPCHPENESTATVVWPRSFREGDASCAYAKLMEDPAAQFLGETGQHYTELDMMSGDGKLDMKTEFMKAARRVQVPAGGLLLWRSKTVHTGAERGPRLAQAVCLEPQARRSAQERLAKLRMAALGLPSMHWASHGIQHDCVRLMEGYLTQGREVKAQDGNHHSAVQFPLRSTVRPWCSPDGALEALLAERAPLVNASDGKGLEQFTELLERCVSEEAKAIL